MKKFAPIVIVCLAISFFYPAIGIAQTDAQIQERIAETQRQREILLEEQKKLQASLDALNKEHQTLQGTVSSLDASRKKLESDLKITQNKIGASNLTIQKLEGDIDENEATIRNSRRAIESSIRKLAEYDSHSVVFDLLTYDSLTEVWTDATNLLDAQDALATQIQVLEDTQLQLVKNKTAKEGEKTKLVTLSSELKGQKQTVEATQTAKQQLLIQTLSKEAEFQKLLAENKAREEEFEKQLFQYESQLKASAPSETPQPKKGILSWPLDSVMITQQFGRTSSSGRLYSSGTHNGIDFRASVGTAVKSAGAGIVSGTGNTDEQRGCYSYGRWILIKHSNGLSTIYAHLSGSTVTTGQAVTAGQIIGYSGGVPRAFGSGYSTGPHLHFGVFVSAGVTISRYSSSLNCKNVSIPLANPQDYLDPAAYLPSL